LLETIIQTSRHSTLFSTVLFFNTQGCYSFGYKIVVVVVVIIEANVTDILLVMFDFVYYFFFLSIRMS